MDFGESTSDVTMTTTTATETSKLKNEAMVNGTSKKHKVPYVLLKRWSLEEINNYKVDKNPDDEINLTSEQLHSNSLNLSSLVDDSQRLFHSYVLLERFSPGVIQNLLTKKKEQ